MHAYQVKYAYCMLTICLLYAYYMPVAFIHEMLAMNRAEYIGIYFYYWVGQKDIEIGLVFL